MQWTVRSTWYVLSWILISFDHGMCDFKSYTQTFVAYPTKLKSIVENQKQENYSRENFQSNYMDYIKRQTEMSFVCSILWRLEPVQSMLYHLIWQHNTYLPT